MKEIYQRRIVQLILLFWTLYFSLVAIADIIDGLQELNIINESWKFSSGNFEYIASQVSIYNTPIWLVTLFFIGTIAWVSLGASLLWKALLSVKELRKHHTVYLAFLTTIGYFAALTIASEVFLIYDLIEKHMVMVMILLLSFYICHRLLYEK